MNTLPMRSPVYINRIPRSTPPCPRSARRPREGSIERALAMWGEARAAHTRRAEPDPERTLPMRIPMFELDASKG
jgi:hypothetical protein